MALDLMNPLLIFGAGGQAKCIANAAIQGGESPFAFLDDNPKSATLFGLPVLFTETFSPPTQFRFIVAVGNPVFRREKFDWLKRLGGEPATIIHPDASVSLLSEIGPGTIVFANAMLDPCVSIGENCIVNCGAMIGHDSVVENDAHVSAGAIVGAMSRIGRGAFVGIGAMVNPATTIGEFAYIAMGAMISKDVPPNMKAISPHRKEAVLLPA